MEIKGKPAPDHFIVVRGRLSLSKNLCLDESARVLAGELEGAAARLEWDQMP